MLFKFMLIFIFFIINETLAVKEDLNAQKGEEINYYTKRYEDVFIRESTDISEFRKLSPEIICYIGNLLEGENEYKINNFSNFALTCKHIYNLLKENKKLFLYKDDDEIVDCIKEISFQNLNLLSLRWSRIGKLDTINKLKKFSKDYLDHNLIVPMSSIDYVLKMYNFGMYVKFILLNHFLNNNYDELYNLKKQKFLQYYSNISLDLQSSNLLKTQLAVLSEKVFEDLNENKNQHNNLEILQNMKEFLPITKFFYSIEIPEEVYNPD